MSFPIADLKKEIQSEKIHIRSLTRKYFVEQGKNLAVRKKYRDESERARKLQDNNRILLHGREKVSVKLH